MSDTSGIEGVAPGSAAVTATGEAAIETAPPLEFVSELRLLTNRFLWWDFAKVVTLSVLGMYVAVFLASIWADPTDPVLLPPIAMAIAGGALLVLMVIACLLMGNRWSFSVRVGPEGVGWSAGARERRIDRVVGVLNLASGRPGAIGASALAISGEDGRMTWDRVRRASYHEDAHVISLRDSWHVVQRLFVPADVWPQAVAAVESGIAQGARLRSQAAATGASAPRRNAFGVAGLVVLAVVATLAAQAWTFVPDEARGPGLFAGVLVVVAVILAGPVRRLAAGLGLVACAWFALLLGFEAIAPFRSMFTGASTPTWTLDTPQLAISVAGVAALIALALARLLGRGRAR